jgi:hypothetical protein
VHENDLIAATQGRGIWILDDVTPLRMLADGQAPSPLRLVPPAEAVRLRRSEGKDTPLPETPLGETRSPERSSTTS